MKKLIFFLATKKKIQPRDRMNEWQCELLQEKKTHKKHPKMWKKKKHTRLSKKIKKNPPDPE